MYVCSLSRKIVLLIILSLILLSSGWIAHSLSFQSPISIKGVWYISRNKDDYASPKVSEELGRLKEELGVNYVALVIRLFQDTVESTDPDFDPNRTPSIKTLKYVVDRAHELSLGVILLPYLLTDDVYWVGELQPHDVGTWFENWRKILRHYAVFAEVTGVEGFLLGWEFETLRPYHEEWELAIDEVRRVYSGMVSYYTNWWYDRDEYGQVLNWSPWVLLDFIGVSAWFELTRKNDPTVEELQQAWYADANEQNIIEDLEQLSAQYGKCIVLWELGYESKDGTNQEPWNYFRPGPSDQQEQRDTFAAAFQVLSDQPWFAGYVVWGEEVGLPKTSRGYDVLDKEAERVIEAHVLAPKACAF